MNLSTLTTIPKSDFSISHQTPITLIGSCFAENIGKKLKDNKFDVNINPNGIIFNPISVVNSLKRVIKNQKYSAEELIEHNGKWLSLNHHSSFSAVNKEDCLTKINTSLENAHQHLKKSKTIVITFGSVWVYEYGNLGIVANCHKIPNKNFAKRLLSVKEILNAFDTIKEELKNYNVLFTISPVRHSKDGLHENNLSKASLLLAVNNLVMQNANYHYFPAYEIVIDELRDYRFYKDDLVHPTELAINYIWQKFGNCFFSEETQNINTAIQKIKVAANHKPFNFDSNEHQQFISKQITLMEQLSEQYSYLNFDKEKEFIKTQ